MIDLKDHNVLRMDFSYKINMKIVNLLRFLPS